MAQTQKHVPLTLVLLDWSQAGRLSAPLCHALIAPKKICAYANNLLTRFGKSVRCFTQKHALERAALRRIEKSRGRISILSLFIKRHTVQKRLEIAGSVGAILAFKGSAGWSIAPNSMVFDAIQLMADKNVGALLVLDNGQSKDAPCPRYTTLDKGNASGSKKASCARHTRFLRRSTASAGEDRFRAAVQALAMASSCADRRSARSPLPSRRQLHRWRARRRSRRSRWLLRDGASECS